MGCIPLQGKAVWHFENEHGADERNTHSQPSNKMKQTLLVVCTYMFNTQHQIRISGKNLYKHRNPFALSLPFLCFQWCVVNILFAQMCIPIACVCVCVFMHLSVGVHRHRHRRRRHRLDDGKSRHSIQAKQT